VAVVTGPLLVLADCYRDAFDWAMDLDLGSEGRAWRHIWRPEHVQGLRGGRYVRISRGSMSPAEYVEQDRVVAALRAAGFEEVTEP
jgi:hypothetical protein